MSEKMSKFDLEAFYAAINTTRQSRSLNWKQVSQESGVSASTLTRMAQGKRPDLDGFAALASWSQVDPRDFVKSSQAAEGAFHEPLAKISSQLRSDRNLSPEGAEALEAILVAAYEQLRDRGNHSRTD